VADLLNRVNAMAAQSNLKIVGFKPQATSKKTLVTEWPYGLQLEGSYHDLGMFLERISKFPRDHQRGGSEGEGAREPGPALDHQ
jgi:Tfp pilus assembly protein PilO